MELDGKSEFDRSEVSGAPLEGTRRRQGRAKLLLSAYAVLFTRYCIATFLSSFFTPLATQMGISGTFNGAIFAAYPLGMAITSVFAPQLIERMGTRSAVFNRRRSVTDLNRKEVAQLRDSSPHSASIRAKEKCCGPIFGVMFGRRKGRRALVSMSTQNDS